MQVDAGPLPILANMNTDTKETLQSLKEEAKHLGKLYLDIAKYTMAEKATMLFSAMGISVVLLALAMGVLVFLTMALVHLLATFLPIAVVYLIMALLLVIIIALIYMMRTPLIHNTVARFVSRLFLDPPSNSRQ